VVALWISTLLMVAVGAYQLQKEARKLFSDAPAAEVQPQSLEETDK
jgi:hypothetical protein